MSDQRRGDGPPPDDTLQGALASLRSALDRLKEKSQALPHPAAPAGRGRGAALEATFTLTIVRVSAERLAQLTDRAEVVQALDEILANVLGTERWVLYGVDPEHGELRPLAGRGGAEGQAAPVSLAHSSLGRLASRQTVTLGALEPGAPAAVVPLVHAGRLYGAIEVVEFLPHKRGLAAHDEEVCRLLVSAGGRALQQTGSRAAR